MKIVTIIGARPQFIKAAAVSRLLRQQHTEILVHTGQHYDANMSDIFFKELDIAPPEVHLNIGSGSHGTQTGTMLAKIEAILSCERPEWVLVYGDTNSTLAGALAAAKLHIPIAHVEAGLRSFNRAMPEEINRIVTDHISTLLLCPSQIAVNHLANEGIQSGVKLVGDVMHDTLHNAVVRAETESSILQQLDLKPDSYFLATIHRAENTDNHSRLQSIFSAFLQLNLPVILPLHPRTRAKLGEKVMTYANTTNLNIVEPVGYLDMVALQRSAKAILTDSGGIQKEAYWLGTPCITLRDETEWVETVEICANIIVGADPHRILQAVQTVSLNAKPDWNKNIYGDHAAAKRCVDALEHFTHG